MSIFGRRKNNEVGHFGVNIPLPDALPLPTDSADAVALGGMANAKYMMEVFRLASDEAARVKPGEEFSVTIPGLARHIEDDTMNFAISLSLLCPGHGLSCNPDAVKGDTITFTRL